MSRSLRPAALGLLLAISLPLGGCASLFSRDPVPIDYFVLTPVAAGGAAGSVVGGPVYAVGPIALPQYLTQSTIAIRPEDNEIAFAADKQWAGPLSSNIGSTLAENLSVMLPSDRVVVLPVGPAVPVDFQVSLDVVRFERQPDGHVALLARWSTFGEGGRRLMGMYRSDLRSPRSADDYPEIASAMSALLADLAREVATALQAARTPSS